MFQRWKLQLEYDRVKCVPGTRRARHQEEKGVKSFKIPGPAPRWEPEGADQEGSSVSGDEPQGAGVEKNYASKSDWKVIEE